MIIWTAILLGLVGSLHCAGMCGPLALALPTTGNSRSSFVLGRLAYNSGRILTYCGLGAVFGLAGVTALRGNRTAFPKPKDGSELIQSGVYAWVRHPLYSSVLLVSLGWALAWQSAIALVLALSMGPFFYAKAKLEERWLRARFSEYAEYESRVCCRFLPFIF